MGTLLTEEDYEDIVSTLILISLSYEELLKLDGPGFPIDFEVWSETRRVFGILEYRSSYQSLSPDLIQSIKEFFSKLLDWPSENWNHEQFEGSSFWEDARSEAQEFVHLLGAGERGYWH